MKKGQTAVPAVLLTIMALIVWYVLWIYPEQRYELLFGSEESNESEVGTVVQENHLYSVFVGEIGKSSGTVLQRQEVYNLSVSYPVTRSTVADFGSLILSSNLLLSEHKTVDLSAVDGDINVEMVSSSVEGTPNVFIKLNSTTIYDSRLLPSSKTSVDILRKDVVDKGNILQIGCKFQGMNIFSTQKCGFSSLVVYKYVYAPLKVSDTEFFYLTPEGEGADFITMGIDVYSANNYPIDIYINRVKVFSGRLSSGLTTLTIDADNLNLSYANNLTVVAEPGAEYGIGKIELDMQSVPSGLAARYVSAYFNESVLKNNENFELSVEVEKIKELGDIVVEFVKTGDKYYIPHSDIVVGDNKILIPSTSLISGSNNIKIYSENGRFELGYLTIDEVEE